MKSDDVQRGIKPGQPSRKAGDAPGLGRITVLRDSKRPPVRGRQKRQASSEKAAQLLKTKQKNLLIVSILLGLLTFGTIGVMLMSWLLPAMKRSARSGATPGPVQVTVEPADVPSLSPEEGFALVDRALAVEDPAEVPRFFRHPEADAAEVVVFLQQFRETSGGISQRRWMGNLTAESPAREGVVLSFKGPERGRIAFLVPDVKGEWRVDFAALARTSTPVASLLSKEVEGGRLRAFAGTDSYYNGPFRDESQWECYGLATDASEEVLFGYCRTGSPQAAAMQKLLKHSPKAARVTVEVAVNPEAAPRQFEIVRVLGDWVVGDEADDGSQQEAGAEAGR